MRRSLYPDMKHKLDDSLLRRDWVYITHVAAAEAADQNAEVQESESHALWFVRVLGFECVVVILRRNVGLDNVTISFGRSFWLFSV